jgi:AcrR family transcriptional regulator
MSRPRTVSDEEILAAAMTAIGRHGPARLTLAHVAQEVGLSPAALVQRFGSKAGLLRAAASRGADRADAVFDGIRATVSSPIAALLQAMVEFGSGIATREEMANHIGMLQLDLTEPDLHEQAVAQAQTLRNRIAQLVEEAATAGELDVGDVDGLAETVYTVYNGALVTWAIVGSGPLDDWVRDRVDRILAPYRPPDP